MSEHFAGIMMDSEPFFLEENDDFPADKQVHQLFAEHAALHPDRTALVEDDKELTYGELDRITDSIAAGLIAAGIKADEAVGVYIDRSINYIIAILSVMKSGGCYVPIDPDIPAERLSFIINDTGCRQILSESQYTDKLAGFMDKTILLDKLDLSALTPLTEPPAVSPSALAYIIYTSGSTGTPKGVEIEHASLLNLVHWHHQTFVEEGHYRVSQSAGPGFDASVREIWVHLTNGATIYIIPEMLRLQPQKLVDWLTEKKINECSLSTPVAELALGADWRNNASLKYMQCGGEKLNRKPGRGFPAILANLYGPTECAVDSTRAMFKAGEDDGKLPHIGTPVSNFRIYILDENLNPAPRGAEGEICIGGAGLARGYRNLPELTSKAFVPDPFLPGKRIYRSGDLGRINADGNIECSGRKDFQVKIRGFRIEPGEIEAVLTRHENVSKCVVAARDGGDGAKYLAAYFILKKPMELKLLTEEVHALLSKSVPEYMIPATCTILQELPLTLNGKVDREKLPEPDFIHEGTAAMATGGDDPLLQTLSSIWRQLLKQDYVNPDDNFFMLGGHSLLATAMILEIEKQLLVQLPITLVFSHPTLKQLSQAVRYCSGSSRAAVRFEKARATKNDLYHASAAQTAMWYMEKSSHENNAFNIPFEIYLQGDVKPDILDKAFNLIVRQNESLRSSFTFVNEQLYIKINQFRKTEIPFLDLSILPENEIQQRYYTEISIQRFHVFELSSAPLFNCILLKLKADDFRFIFTVHHLIFDGWSTFLFFKQLMEYYYQFSLGREPAVSAVQWQYVDYCRWQKNYFKTYGAQVQLKYWQKKLDNYAVTPPLPVQKQLQSRSKSRRYHVKINQEVTCGLKKLAQSNNASLFMALTALLQLQIHKYTGATDIITGTTIANRNLPETEDIIGMFINALALRNKITGNPSFNEFLEQVKNTLLEAYENQDIPYSMVLKNCGAGGSGGKSLFRISMLLQNLPWPEANNSSVKMCYEELGSDTAKMDIMIVLRENDNMLHGWYEYDTSGFDEKDIEAFFQHYIYLAESLTKNPDALMSEIHLPWENIRRRSSCYIIGETALTKAAGDILLNNGFYINGIFTDEAKSAEWAKEHEIPRHPPQKQIISDIVSSVRPDYLFSIINSSILDQHILDQPLKYAVNYHDAPLPRYAGLYATAWAIINHEHEHGVTWHRMTTEVDAGDILKQQDVSISPYDTSVSLNIKCSQEALGAFESLVQDMKDGVVSTMPQDLSQRTYNPQHQRPPDACVIDFNHSVENISALARALTFGDYDNPLGTLKILCGDAFHIVRELSIASRKTASEPGKIIEVNNEKGTLCVAAGNGVVKLSGLCDPEGNALEAAAAGLRPGQSLTENFNRRLLDRYYKECAGAEMFWVKRLRSARLPDVAILPDDEEISSSYINAVILDCIPAPGISPAAVFALFLGRISCEDEFDIPVNAGYSAGTDFPSIFANTVPLRVKLNFSKTAEENLAAIEKSLKSLPDRKTFCRDIFTRYRNIRRIARIPYKIKLAGNGACELELYQQHTEKFIKCYYNFCANLLKSTNAPLGEISILSGDEASRIIYEWNNTSRNFDLQTPYIRQFEKQAEKYPDKCAAKSAAGSLTYKELDCRANQLAAHLLRQGVGGSRIIGVLTDKSLEMAVAILAVFKAGCIYMPLDVQRQSPERIEAMIYDSGTTVILSALRARSQQPGNIPGYIRIINLTDTGLYSETDAASPPDTEISTSDTAYIMYTSGSTGAPKGVMISQSNLLNHNYSVISDYALTANDKALQFSTLGFDISVEEIFPTWLTGGTLVFMPDGMLESPPALIEFIRKEKISFLDLPTSYWHELAAMQKKDFPDCVRIIAIGGEKASPERFARWRKNVPQTRVINTYGPTETTVIATLGDNPETIGRPLANTHVYVLDKLMQPVPAGSEGELYIAGANVAQGYLNRPAETAAAFMSNPFVKGERMYRTGDKVKFAPDGELIFAGRMDDQFKIRGFRVEPGDIEAVLSSHPEIRTAVVKLWQNEKTGVKSLAAYFVPAVKTYSLSNIHEFVKSQLPEYMVPACFTAIDAIPMTPNGKINRRALPQPEFEIASGRADDNEPSEPQSQLEMQIRLAFSKILNIKNIDGDTNLPASDIDSLSAIKLLMEIETQTGAKIPVEKLYQSMSVNAICNYIHDSGGHGQIWNPVIKLAGGEDKPPLFLIHTTPGDVLGYINLVHHLDDRPVYGIQSLGLNSPEKAHRSIEAMAAYYISEIFDIYPEGPYLLCGWCFGGYVAYEMAQQLNRMGKKVAFLGLIETYAHLKPLFFNYMQRISSVVQWGPGDYINYLNFKIKRRFHHIRNIDQLDFISRRFANSSSEQAINNMKSVYRYNVEAASGYFMQYYSGKVSLFMAKETLKGKIPLPCYGWKDLSKAIDLHTFDSSHSDILRESYAVSVAERIVKCITDAGQ